MRSRAALTTTCLLLAFVAAPPAIADEIVLWDNYPGDALPDASVNMSSERNTQIGEPTWIVDDVDFTGARFDPTDLSITRLEWIGARDPAYTYSTADVIMFNDFPDLSDPGYTVEYEGSNLAYTFEDLVPDPIPDPDVTTYKGTVTFDTPLSLADLELGGHFYIGVRLVSDTDFHGRNFFVTSSFDESLYGQTEGYIWAPIFGADFWRPASDVWYGVPPGGEPTAANFEFAFRMYGIPEPTSLGLLAAGGVALLTWRRRSPS